MTYPSYASAARPRLSTIVVMLTTLATLVLVFIAQPWDRAKQPGQPAGEGVNVESPQDDPSGDLPERLKAVRTWDGVRALLDGPDGAAVLRAMLGGLLQMLVFFAGLAVCATLLISRAWGSRLLPDTGVLPVRITVRDTGLAFAFFVIVLIASLFSYRLMASGGNGEPSGSVALSIATGGMALSALFCALLAWEATGGILAPLGLAFRGMGRNITRGVVAFFAVFPALMAVQFAVILIAKEAGIDREYNPAIGIARAAATPLQLAAILATIIVAMPVFEELIFRGFLYPALRRVMPAWLAMAGSAIPFALLHPPLDVAPILVIAVALAYMRERTGSLVPCIVMHCLLNGLTMLVVMLSPWSG